MQPWSRWREPLAVGLLVVLAGMLVLRSIGLSYALPGAGSAGVLGSLPGADALLLLATTAALVWCTTPVGHGAEAADPPSMSPHAYPIAVAGLVVVGLTVVGWLALAVWDLVEVLGAPNPAVGFVLQVVEGLLRLAVPLAALVAVLLAVRRAATARRAPERKVTEPPEPVPGDEPAVPATPERLPAAWQADEATGAVWLTADDAAQGRPGLSWSGSPDAPGGWAPDPDRRPSTGPDAGPATGQAASQDASQDDDLR